MISLSFAFKKFRVPPSEQIFNACPSLMFKNATDAEAEPQDKVLPTPFSYVEILISD